MKRKETYLPALAALGSLTELEGSLNGKLFIFAEMKLRRGHRSLAGGTKIESACYISGLKCISTALSDKLPHLVWWLKFNENCIEVCRLA